MKKKMSKQLLILAVLVIATTVVTACGPRATEVDIDMQKTGFAQTAEAQTSMTAAAIPTETPTPEVTPTATFTLTPTAGTPTATATSTGPTATFSTGGADVAQWRANDPPDNTVFAPGEEFTVTWTLENTGTSTWTTGYYIQFYSGEQMDADDEVYLPYAVPPGTNVQISVDFIAPDSNGAKRSDWILKNANDETFYSFYIVIEVGEKSTQPTTAPASATPNATATTETP
ncbi:MAG: NBR1-Ig-like domain-containing protein [Chloroflexota bacterium]|nr:NBR1-Ig-like domain-containing protein [Chloroflexota bacterium]